MREPGSKRLLFLGDFHAGHMTGLRPPGWIVEKKQDVEFQLALWKFYTSTIAELGHIDICVINGDIIDGQGKRSSGVELIETDMERQTEMAVDSIKMTNADKYVITRGTAYHTSNSGSYGEYAAAKELGAEYGGHIFLDVNGHIFDVRHHIGNTSVPHSIPPIKRAWVNNALLAERDLQPRSNTIVRNHVHSFNYVGNDRFLGLTVPALQGPGSIFGEDRCEGDYSVGMIKMDVSAEGKRTWEWYIMQLAGKKEAIKL